MNDRQRLEAIVAVVCKYLPPDGISREEAMNQIIGLVDPLPEQPEQTKRVCNTCDGTGMIKGLHNWAGGGKRTESCWACHEVADEKKEPALRDADPRLLLGRSNNFTKETENRLCDIERRLAAIETQPALAQPEQAHTDHPMRHWDRTCPACVAESANSTSNFVESKHPAQPEQHHEPSWQAGFAEGKQAAMNQFIRDECDKRSRPHQEPVAAVELITIGSEQVIAVAWHDSNAFKVGTKLYTRPISKHKEQE